MAEKTKKIKKVKKPKGVESLKSRYGRLFVLPWEIGLVLFFVIPLITSIIYSFSTVTLGVGGVNTTWVGLEHYNEIINKDPNYLNELWAALENFAISLPITVALSLILAIILNQKFRGRVVARAIFFLPVIIATGVVIELMTSDSIGISLMSAGTTDTSGAAIAQEGGNSMIDFNVILGNLGLPQEAVTIVGGYIGDIFNLLWACGIQIVLFIAGLQTIPDQLYEVSRVEGASKWEEFWFITIPMLGQTLLLVMVYTMIDIFTKKQGLMATAFGLMEKDAVYDRSSAMIWFYFVIVAAIMSLVLFLYNKFLLKKWS